ncbi:MAG: N-acetylmuramic acid 6-phosphate etherase [Halanaerobiales bacterium]
MEKENLQRITEKRNPQTMDIDQMNTEQILKVMNKEDENVISAVNQEIPSITRAVDIITEKMKKGGRLFYIGAGTSGRLGVLDAVECKPTFSIESGRITGILAGGKEAMFESQENIEDKEEIGADKIKEYDIDRNDTVVGIAASGKTPFVLGALTEAKKRGAVVIGLTSAENSLLEKKSDIAIIPVVGPEVITGSTRMKAGTAQKIILNMISTTVMIKMGKVYSNLMVDLNPANQKLRNRARNMFKIITDTDENTARDYLEKANYEVKKAVVMYEKKVDLEMAKNILKENEGILREVID